MKQVLTDLHLRVLEKEAISCGDVEALMGDYTDRELSCSVQARLDAHIAGCPDCQEFAKSYQFTVKLASELKDRPVSRDVQNRLRTALNARLGLSLPLVD